MHPALYKIINRLLSRKPLREKNIHLPGNKSLNILIIIPYAPYPVYTGGASRIFEKIKYFGSRHYLVIACCYKNNIEKKKTRKLLEAYCNKLILVERKKPYIKSSETLPEKVLHVSIKNMWDKLANIKIKFDVVMFEHIYTAMYRPLFENCFTVLEEHNIESKILEQFSKYIVNNSINNTLSKDLYQTLRKETDLLEEFETQNWSLFNLRTTVSQVDCDIMGERCNNKILVVKNGINTSEILPVEYNGKNSILFMGHMSYQPNIQGIKYFVDCIFPILQASEPNTVLYIAGRDPAIEIMKLVDGKNIICISNPDDMSSIASSCYASVVPLQMGSGTRIKIMHSMALGLPVISTSIGCEGMTITDGKHLLIRDDPESFAQGILEIKRNPSERARLIQNSLLFVRQEHNLNKIFEIYETELFKILTESG